MRAMVVFRTPWGSVQEEFLRVPDVNNPQRMRPLKEQVQQRLRNLESIHGAGTITILSYTETLV